MSRDETQSDEDDEDGDDEDEVEKVGEKRDEGDGAEDQMVTDTDPGPAVAEEGSFVREQDCQEEKTEEKKASAEDEVAPCETSETKNVNQTENKNENVDKAVSDQSVENMEGDENIETVSANTNKDSPSEAEGDTQHLGTVESITQPMEVEATETSTTDASAAARREEDTGTG